MSDTETDVQLPEDEVEEVEEVRSLDDWSGTSSDDDSGRTRDARQVFTRSARTSLRCTGSDT